VGFKDAAGTAVTKLDITSALDGTYFEFVIEPAPKQRYRLVYTRISGGAADTMDFAWS
jgi:hypothetical protein